MAEHTSTEHTSTDDESAQTDGPLRRSAGSRLASLYSARRRGAKWDSLTPEQQADAASHVFRGNL